MANGMILLNKYLRISINYAFRLSLILLLLVTLNIYFSNTLSTMGKKNTPPFRLPNFKLGVSLPNIKLEVHREIYEYLNYLPSRYKNKNTKFLPVQRNLIRKFNTTSTNLLNTKNIWEETENWASDESLYPHMHSSPGKILLAMKTSRIVEVDIAPLGKQLKLLLTLEGKKKFFFKPKRYDLKAIIHGNLHTGYDRHNSEVFAYYLAMVMNFKWIAPAVIRRIHVFKDVVPAATKRLLKTIIKNGTKLCIYGKCVYCEASKSVCPDKHGEIEGAVTLLFEKEFRFFWSTRRRSKINQKMYLKIDKHYCKNISERYPLNLILNLVDVSVFDFLIQNGDRQIFQVYNEKIMLFDNGKGLGNPMVDELDILAPLYQCCKMSYSTWQHLEMLSGGILTETIKLLASFQGETLATEDHYKAVERRLLKIYAAVQYCIGKRSSGKVFIIS